MKAAHGTARGILRSSLGYPEAGLDEEQNLGVAKHLTALAFPLCWISRACKSFHIKREVEKHLRESPCLEKLCGGSS